MLLGLPLTGILIAGRPIGRYLEFPPQTRFIQHAPYSWLAFGCYAVFIIGVLIFLISPLFYKQQAFSFRHSGKRRLPWWGWMSLFTCILFWGIAWSRFAFVKLFQPHTFAPLWISFIVWLNALTFRRTGRSLLTHKTRLFFILFPLSAAFWWFFEYLNRFVQNWYYVGVKFEALEYFLYATISFSTVLPAVVSMHAYVISYIGDLNRYHSWIKIQIRYPKILSWCVLVIAGCGLGFIGILPDYVFPLLWISPLLIVVSLQAILGESHILSDVIRGNWMKVVSFPLAALGCGFFWEMWNFYSLAKWQYGIPFVHRFQLFEMPILGYAGYLPFGLECAMVAMIVEDWLFKL
ncbi:MAG: hypothetical protein KJN80_07295 [Deltaproteobacteria bacterium]|nr:hypothetical protein [Deltaproteobacteria bacterium]